MRHLRRAAYQLDKHALSITTTKPILSRLRHSRELRSSTKSTYNLPTLPSHSGLTLSGRLITQSLLSPGFQDLSSSSNCFRVSHSELHTNSINRDHSLRHRCVSCWKNMPPAAKACIMPNPTSQSGALEAVEPHVFARVQESKGAIGPIHEIEILAKSLGCF